MSHTKGPWRVHPKDLSGAYQVVPGREGALRICTVTNGPEDKDNADLIAASPPLYSALAQASEVFNGQCNLLSTATGAERRVVIENMINWWNNEALPALRLVDSEAWP
ncbi:MAG: hypothetical protein ACLQVJ_00030 [Syntrophobacteraceae bacterium]